MNYYVDTCIYVNLWKKEIADNGFSYYEIAGKFFDKINREGDLIYYSGYLLKELSFVLGDTLFVENIPFFLYSGNFVKVKFTRDEYERVKEIYSANKGVSFFDIVHMLLARKNKSTLITRDRELMELCRKFNVLVKTPEQVLRFF